MLIDLPGNWREVGSRLPRTISHELAKATGGRSDPLRVHRGIYEAHLNFEYEIRDLLMER